MTKYIYKKKKKINFLLTIEYKYTNKYNQQVWLFECDCGTKKELLISEVYSGRIKSCGCYKNKIHSKRMTKYNTRHGLSKHPLYSIWCGIKNRCYNTKCSNYYNYGNRGIIMCQEWKNNFEIFYNWALSLKWKKGLQIDRIDNNGNYCPENCRLVTKKENCTNKRNNVNLTFNGKTQCISKWTKELDFKKGLIHDRLSSGWSVEKTLTTPKKHK